MCAARNIVNCFLLLASGVVLSMLVESVHDQVKVLADSVRNARR